MRTYKYKFTYRQTIYYDFEDETAMGAENQAAEFCGSDEFYVEMGDQAYINADIDYEKVCEYISLEEVILHWSTNSICVEYPDGTDALLQESGYTLEDCIKFVEQGCKFFYD